MSKSLSHFDEKGQAHMVDVSHKAITQRVAVAEGTIRMSAEAFELLKSGTSKKGDVLGVARIAAIQGGKQTSSLIPLCHPLPITKMSVEFELLPQEHSVKLIATVQTSGQTGVEMEALCTVNIGLLTIYDMLKAADKGMQISNIQLLHKSGGKSGDWHRPT
ncbi:cyclic pyranopterin monophosphate synthase MoaC [Brackiella oedipodis]|uniref:cyclic pyranopterin monophosphate synthase MoaC n=1 Tax=Brackiella oedipodis TaxID=124225 RepID=UPI00056F6852|nr:cyclic pyranopterin monophosphate synthase MoaC [Brackiella oedipodis]